MATLNYIYIGSVSNPSFYFDNESLLSLNVNVATAMIEDELKIDTLEFSVNYNDEDGKLRALEYATPIYYYAGSNAVGVFYFKNIRRYGTNYYEISAVSFVGLLEYEKFYGGMYVRKNIKELYQEIMLSDGLNIPSIGLDNYIRYSGVSLNDFFDVNSVSVPVASVRADPVLNESSTLHIKFAIHDLYTNNNFSGIKAGDVYYIKINPANNRSYQIGVDAIQFPDSSPVILLACLMSDSGSSFGGIANFEFDYDDIIDVIIDPTSGVFSWSVNYRDRVTQTFTDGPIENMDNSYAYYPEVCGESSGKTPKYDLITLEWFDENNVKLAEIIPVVKVSNNQLYFKDTVANYIVRPVTDTFTVYGEPEYDGFGSYVYRNTIWSDGADQLNISGWLPISSKREAIHQILFAMNLNITKSNSGEIIIGKLLNEVSKELEDDDIYNSGSVESVKQPLNLSVTEFSYNIDSGSSVVVFENTEDVASAGEYIVQFNSAPIYSILSTSDTLTVVSYNSNAAIIAGYGSITAQIYKQSKKDIVSVIGDRIDGGSISATNDTLITALNSKSVMRKLVSYYGGNVYLIKNSIIENGEKCGRKYQFHSPFGDETEAFLSSYVLNSSSVIKLDCEFVSGFVPQDIGGDYNNFTVLAGSGTWDVPEEVFSKTTPKIYVVVIGGGQGGSSGFAGQDGRSVGQYYNTASVARGGMYGANGSGGKINIIEIENPDTSYSYSCGAGGQGGALCSSTDTNNVGELGTASTFGTYSSDDGEVSEIGYTNILNGEVYAYQMPLWNASSGKGGNGEYVTIAQDKTITRYPTETIYNMMTGFKSQSRWYGADFYMGTISHAGESPQRVIEECGGGNGGAAFDLMGGEPEAVTNPHYPNERFSVIGGDGATPTYVPPKATLYNPRYFGYGGMGGPGGGGGGHGGAYTDFLDWESDKVYSYSGGSGGQGGRGGDGGDGCIVIYY